MYLLYNLRRPANGRRRSSWLPSSAVLAFLLVAFPQGAWAQESDSTQWTLLKEVENVRFSYAQKQCESQVFILLSVENTNPTQIFGTWYLNITADGATTRYAGALQNMQPMSVQRGSCSRPEPFLAIPQIKISTEMIVSIDVEITKP